MEAFAAGVHVILEKPMSITPASCGRVMAAARATDKVFWIAEQAQYSPVILTAQRLITEGAIGKTLALHTMGGTGRPASMSSFKVAGEAKTGGDGMPTRGRNRGQGSVIAQAGLPADDLRVPLGDLRLSVSLSLCRSVSQSLSHHKRTQRWHNGPQP